MKKNFIALALLLSLFYVISNEILEIPTNFAEIELKESSSFLFYDFPEAHIQEGKSIYFFFKFLQSSYNQIDIKVFNEDGEEDSLPCNSYYDFCCLEILNKTSQQFTFKVTNYYSDPIKIIFIDNSREININLDFLFGFDLQLTELTKEPLPLIFNVGLVDEKTIMLAEIEKPLEYCIDNEYECLFESFKNVNFEKGKKYKIKLESYIETNYYGDTYTLELPYFSIIKEIEFGARILSKTQQNAIIFIMNIKNNERFNLYLNDNNIQNSYETTFITEYEKENILDIINNLNMEIRSANDLIEVINYNSVSNYLLIIIKKGKINNGFICAFNDYYEFNYYSNFNDKKQIEIEKGRNALINYNKYYSNGKKVLVSSNKNMAILDSSFKASNLTNIFILVINNNDYYSDEEKTFIYISPSNERNTTIKLYDYKNPYSYNDVYFKLYSHSLFKDNKIDSFFKRTFSHSMYLGFNIYYLFDLNEEYYLFLKKYYGNIQFYKYNGQLNSLTEISEFNKPIINLEHNREYTLINNNELIKLSGFEVISFFNTYNSLFDVFIQKVEDSQNIEIDPYEYQFNNVVKLLKANKPYYIKFTVDHLIKLDDNFLGATVTFKYNGQSYSLNNERRVTIDVKGDNIEVKSDKEALIYFYKRIENEDIKTIVFDKNQKSKNMKFTITNKNNKNEGFKVGIIKDFCFEGYFPMINNKNNAHFKTDGGTTTIYIENLYDKLESQLHENEKFIIYLYNIYDENGIPHFELDKFDIGEPEYFDNLITARNKYNFEVIPPNTNGAVILDSIAKKDLLYQIFVCKNEEVKVIINEGSETRITKNENDNYNIRNEEYDTLRYTFESSNEFLFAYSFKDEVKYDENENKDSDNTNPDSSDKKERYDYLFKLYEDPVYISELDNNKIFVRIEFDDYISDLNSCYIIIAKKDSLNNKDTFSDRCYLAKLMIDNNNSILVYSTYVHKNKYIIADIDVSKLNIHAKDEIVVSAIKNNIYTDLLIDFILTGETIVDKNQPKQFNIGEKVDHLFEYNNYFYYHFEENHPKRVFFSFNRDIEYILYREPDKDIQILSSVEYRLLEITFSKIGNYYFEFKFFHDIYLPIYSFNTFEAGKTNVIDLNKNAYYNDILIMSKLEIEQTKYKIYNLNEDKYVFFYYKEDWGNSRYYFLNSENPFEVCDEEKHSCESNIVKYHFYKNKNYTININCDKTNNYNGYNEYYFLTTFSFFPIRQNNIEEQKDNGFLVTNQPKIYYINLNNNKNNKEQNLYLHHEGVEIIYVSSSDSDINPQQVYDLTDYSCYEPNYYPIQISTKKKYAIILVIPDINSKEARIMIANDAINYNSIETISTTNSLLIYDKDYEIIKNNETLFSFKNIKNKIIKAFNLGNKNCDINITDNKNKKDFIDLINETEEEMSEDGRNDNYDEEYAEENYREKINFFKLYNTLSIYSSSINNMRFTSTTNPSEKYNFLIQNYFGLPIHIEANKDKENINSKYDLNITTYKPRYSFFGAIDDNLFELYLNYISKDDIKDGIELNYKDLLPINVRINTDRNTFYDFVNFYFHNFNQKINVYIKKFYGETEIYECNADSININDLSILTTPLSNCKDKKSIFNRIFSFDGTKLISGYFGHNSYFDIYVEFEDNKQSIKLSPTSNKLYNIASKYLRKNIEYTLDFNASHLVKLEPGFNAEITIYKDEKEVGKLNSENPTSKLEGTNYKIKSNNDAMVYFYGKLFSEFEQIQINKTHKGSIQLEITGNLKYILDFGFLGYSPSNYIDFIELYNEEVISEQKMYINLENLYNKLEVELVKDEYLYIYRLNNGSVQVNYLSNNIVEPDNKYTFHYIPKNEDKSIIINNNYGYFTDLIYQTNFCGLSNTKQEVKLTYQDISNPANNKNPITINDNIPYNLKINGAGTKIIKLKSEQDFIFSYSYVDMADELLKNETNWIHERQILSEFKIQNIADKNDISDIISIKFLPNYKHSSTKYIIVISRKNENNTIESFSDKCYLTKLVLEKQKDVIVENTFDVGENDFVNAEVNIETISDKKNNEFIIGIISQELRFEKRLNYYEPSSFYHTKKNGKDDGKNNKVHIIILCVVIAVGLIVITILLVVLLRKRRDINKLREQVDKVSFIRDKNDDDDEEKEENLLE